MNLISYNKFIKLQPFSRVVQ